MNNRNAASNKQTVRILHVPRNIFDKMYRHAREELPLEACGYLAAAGSRVKKLIKMCNIDQSKEHFMFDPEEQFAALEKAEEEGLELMAVYHSHPHDPARPSAEDIKLAYDPEIIHVILSLLPPKPIARAFRIENGKPFELPLRII